MKDNVNVSADMDVKVEQPTVSKLDVYARLGNIDRMLVALTGTMKDTKYITKSVSKKDIMSAVRLSLKKYHHYFNHKVTDSSIEQIGMEVVKILDRYELYRR